MLQLYTLVYQYLSLVRQTFLGLASLLSEDHIFVCEADDLFVALAEVFSQLMALIFESLSLLVNLILCFGQFDLHAQKLSFEDVFCSLEVNFLLRKLVCQSVQLATLLIQLVLS